MVRPAQVGAQAVCRRQARRQTRIADTNHMRSLCIWTQFWSPPTKEELPATCAGELDAPCPALYGQAGAAALDSDGIVRPDV
mmetsp:Transcript_9196/g.23786  ORF Transcript_9196/g.23786 Transcript_9196/m.23786 type:complete len:82 (+) Transcript_9196:267-512(+)